MKTKSRLASMISLMLLAATAAYAQITPLGDAYTNSADPTTKYGTATLLYVDGATETAYIQFNLASIPSGATVSEATLKLYVNSVVKAGSFNVNYVTSAWEESTLDYSNAPTQGAAIASNVALTTADKNQYILINVTPAVQAWLSGSETNNGIALVANSTFNATFDSKESTTTSHPPELDIVFAPGSGGGTITGVTAGTGLSGGGTSGTVTLSNSGVISVTAGTGISSSGGQTPTIAINTSDVPQLGTANTFTGNQTVTGSVSATTGFLIGSNLFDYGSYSNANAFLGFAGNTKMSGKQNTASGELALSANTTGSYNTASGFEALSGNTTGTNNTATGDSALSSNTTANYNTANGFLALGSNISGGANTASGASSLMSNTTGSDNTAAGASSGQTLDASNLTGGNNTFLGYNSGLSTGSLTNATAIGANALVAESNALVLGAISGSKNGGTSVNVGIGTSTPSHLLEVDASATNAQIAMVSAGTDAAISVNNKASGGREYWIDSGSGSAGVGAGNLAIWDNTAGAARLAISSIGQVILGATSDTGDQFSVYQTSSYTQPSGIGEAIGVYGFNAPSGSGLDPGNGIVAYGGDADTSNKTSTGGTAGVFAGGFGGEYSGDGISAIADDGDVDPSVGGYAGFFSGPVWINGTAYGDEMGLKLDHPLDPANKYLFHASVESSEMMNIYSGNVTTDAQGYAAVQLPDWFEILNTDFRYQLTVIGQFAQAIVARKVQNHDFAIRTNAPNVEVSWQITGVRQDAYAKAHPLVVEQEKDARLKGFYTHPALYGAPPEKQVEWARHPQMMKKMQEHRQQIKEKQAQLSAVKQ